MKKIIAAMAFFMAVATTTNAQTDTTKRAYWYYPEQNVYFNPKTSAYSYYDEKTSSWTTNKNLPSTIKVNNQSKKNEVWYNGTDVWMNNAADQKRYGTPATTAPVNTMTPPSGVQQKVPPTNPAQPATTTTPVPNK